MHDALTKLCPVCPVITTPRGTRRGVELVTVISNYSGCGVDFCRCPTCDRVFQVSYRVDEIVERKLPAGSDSEGSR